MANEKLVIVQPYIPAYRKPFFESLRTELLERSISLSLVASNPAGQQAARSDASIVDWVIKRDAKLMRFGSIQIDLGTRQAPWRGADAVVLGHAGSNLDVYRAISARRYGIKLGLWGHIAAYVNKPYAIDAALEKFQLSRADHVFAYTDRGRDFAVELGVSRGKVTSVRNTVDTSSLVSEQLNLHDDDVESFKMRHKLNSKTFMFLGGLDASKRINFLANSLALLADIDSEVKVLVAGDGEQRYLLREAIDAQQVVYLDYADHAMKAMMGRVSRGILMPGRIGLVAVEALVLGIPIISTKWPFHAPEAEYLREGSSLFSIEDSPADYANFIAKFSSKEVSLGKHDAAYPKMSDMVRNFSDGVVKMLNKPGG